MGILSWIVLGGLAGWVASMIMRKNASMGIIANIVVGVIGGFIGGFIMNLLGNGQNVTGFNISSFLIALLGSVVLLAIVNLLTRGKAR